MLRMGPTVASFPAPDRQLSVLPTSALWRARTKLKRQGPHVNFELCKRLGGYFTTVGTVCLGRSKMQEKRIHVKCNELINLQASEHSIGVHPA